MRINCVNPLLRNYNSSFKGKVSQYQNKPRYDKTELETRLNEAECDSFVLHDIYMQTGDERDYERYISSVIYADELRNYIY